MDIPEFTAPSWLNDQDSTTIHQRMMENLPEDLDTTEGGFPWDMTKPTALEKAEALQFHLTEALKVMFSFWAHSSWLDLHAREEGLTRKSAANAEGEIEINGIAGTVIPKDFVFTTRASSDTAAKQYKTTEEITLDESGYGIVGIISVNAGAEYNTDANTVCLMYEPIQGLKTITNPKALSGGADEESDDELRERVVAAEREGTFTGCDSDYVRWALEVAGVGTAAAIPLWNGPGTVKVMIGDTESKPASDTLIERVYEHIVSPNDRSQRLAPIGAEVTIDTIRAYGIDIVFAFRATSEADETEIVDTFKESVSEYLNGDAKEDAAVSYNIIYSMLARIDDVTDITELNITVSDSESAALKSAEVLKIPSGFYPTLEKFEYTREE